MAMASCLWASSQRGLAEAPESLRPLGWTAEAFCPRWALIFNAEPPSQALLHQWQPCVWVCLRVLRKCRMLHIGRILTSHGMCIVADFLFMSTYCK